MAEDTEAISSGAGVVPVGRERPYDGRFNCTICKDLARDAVVSFCGHLFCWSCLVQHLKKRCRFCPVCHEQVSAKKVIPVYGGGKEEAALPADTDSVRPRPGPPLVTVKPRHVKKPSAPVSLEELRPFLAELGGGGWRNEVEYVLYSDRESVQRDLRMRFASRVQRLAQALERNRSRAPEFEVEILPILQ